VTTAPRRSLPRRIVSPFYWKAREWHIGLLRPHLSVQRAAWADEAQPGELSFHESDQWRRSDDFVVDSRAMFGHFGLGPHDYEGKVVLDLGAGSRLRTAYFEGARIVAVEPLAEQFRVLDFSDLDTAYELHAVPGEEFLPQWEHKVDLVVSINVLDHCYDFPAVIDNVARYLAPDGQALLSFDVHSHADPLHPLVITPRACRAVFRDKGLEVTHQSKGFGTDLPYRWHGHPPYALNYVLRRRAASGSAPSGSGPSRSGPSDPAGGG